MLLKSVKSMLSAVGLEKAALAAWQPLKARGWTPWTPLVPEGALSACVDRCLDQLQKEAPTAPFGHYLEFGVSRGTSMSCVYHALQRKGRTDARLIGFDSFEGLPEEADQEGWHHGEYHSTMQATRRYLAQNGVDLDRVELVKGWFQDTLNEATRLRLAIEHASLIMVDCDIYSASKDALNFCAPLIRDRAIIMFDDWGWRETVNEPGQKEAFAEFLVDNPRFTAEPLESYFEHSRVFMVRSTRHS